MIHTSVRTIIRLRRQMEKVGPYRLVAKLGHGAMGVVWEARHALLRRPTAIKLLAPGTGGERALARFEREVQLTAGLTHPSTIAIYDYGRTDEGVFYYAMELLQGINLHQLVTFDGPLPPARVVHLLRQACGALSEAHAAGSHPSGHQAGQPDDLRLRRHTGLPEGPRLRARQGHRAESDRLGRLERSPPRTPALSQDGSLLGTPLYMAPEGMTDPGKDRRPGGSLRAGCRGLLPAGRRVPVSGTHRDRGLPARAPGPAASSRRGRAHPVPPSLEAVILRLPGDAPGGSARVCRGAGGPPGGLRRPADLEARGRASLVAGPGAGGPRVRPGGAPGGRTAPGRGHGRRELRRVDGDRRRGTLRGAVRHRMCGPEDEVRHVDR